MLNIVFDLFLGICYRARGDCCGRLEHRRDVRGGRCILKMLLEVVYSGIADR